MPVFGSTLAAAGIPTTPAIIIPHLRIPFGLSVTGAAQVVEQDTLAEITQCVGQLLGTVLGSREVVPSYGIPDPSFGGPDPGAITDAVALWEPRAAVTVTVVPGRTAAVTVTVEQAPQ